MRFTITLCFLLLSSTVFYAQVGIGTIEPNPSAILDISSTNSGLLIPRITLTGENDSSTIPNPVAGLMIYNTGTNSTNLSTGFVFFDGTKWISMAGWQLNGNTAGSSNFLGTTDSQPLVLKVNNDNRAIFGTDDNTAIGIGSSATTSNSFALGNSAEASAPGAMAIGNEAIATSTNTLILSGEGQVVGIGTSAPTTKLHLNGSLRLEGIGAANGSVLTSDADGNATWKAPASASGAIVGDVKHGFQLTDHQGWYLLDGRAVSSSTLSATARANADALFSGNLPNAENRVLKARTGAEALGTNVGSNSRTITQANLPNYNLPVATTSSNGAHQHNYNQYNTIPVEARDMGNTMQIAITNGTTPTTTTNNGNHTHAVTVNSGGSNIAINTTPASIVTNVFVYLGE